MDLNLYALELVVRDKLARLRAEAALHALVTRRTAPPPRPSPRERVGLALIGLGRWVRGAGLGDLILAELIRRARARGHHSMLARITSANTASLRLHARHGFVVVGVEWEVAWKHDRWLHVTIVQLRL